MALYSRDDDNKNAARSAIRQNRQTGRKEERKERRGERQEVRKAGRKARDESLAAGETRKQARAKKRLARGETREFQGSTDDLMEQISQMHRSSRRFPGIAPRETKPSLGPRRPEAGGIDIEHRRPREEPQNIELSPREAENRRKPSPGELGVTQYGADRWGVNPSRDAPGHDERYFGGPELHLTGESSDPLSGRALTHLSPEEIAEMEAEVARTDRPAPRTTAPSPLLRRRQ